MEPKRHPPILGVTAPGTHFPIDNAVEHAASFVFVHDLRVEQLQDGSYRPCCSCGWSTTAYPSDDPHTAPMAAEDDCIEHALEVGDGWTIVP